MYLFFGLLILFIVTTTILFQQQSQSDMQTYKEKYTSLRQSYVDLAKSQSYILEILMKNTDLQNLMPEYRDLSKDDYTERIRRRIIELKLKTENLEKEIYK
jgi:hypothetical protein